MDSTATLIVLGGAFALAAVLGAVSVGTNFCTMGAVSDWVNIGDLRRLRAWLLAMAVAIAGVTALEAAGALSVTDARIPYTSGVFNAVRHLLGGLLFGIGMTLASGCGVKNLVRVGMGSAKAVVVVIVAGIMAWLMISTRFYELAFAGWLEVFSVDLRTLGIGDQRLGTMAAGALRLSEGAVTVAAGALASIALAVVVLRARDFRTSPPHLLGGTAFGLAVLGGWYLTGGPVGERWIDDAYFRHVVPPGVGVQSFTFISPMAETLSWLAHPGELARVTFGVAAFAGAILGALAWALASGRFRLEWFTRWDDLGRHLAGGVLLGVGGVLALGCTIGQGVTGMSTLALGSVLAAGAMVLGAALTMKVQLYAIVYEEARFGAVLLTALADLRLVPRRLRRLEPV